MCNNKNTSPTSPATLGTSPTSPATLGTSPATSSTSSALLSRSFTNANNTTNNTNKNFLSQCCRCLTLDDRTIEYGALPSVSCSLSLSPLVSLARKVGAEFIGTFIVMFTATAVVILNEKTNGSETLVGCAATTGLVVMVIIFATGHISGAHFNPAVTISFAALKHFSWKHVPIYIGAQVLASICAAFALKWIYHPFMSGGVTVPSGGYGQSFALEFIIAFNLMFVVTAVSIDNRAVGELAGIAVGATVMLNIMIAGPVSGASMNPVRTLGPAIAAKNYKAIWIYLVAPVFGALAGAGTYTIVKLPKEDDVKEKTSISFRK